MEAILSNEDYNEFTNRVNIARERGVDVPHNVEQIGDKYKIVFLIFTEHPITRLILITYGHMM